MTELVEHALGVHLRQRHEDYLEDHGLGYSAIKDIFLSPIEWWDSSPHNPLRVEPDPEGKKAFKRGEALHTFTLYGEKTYARTYGVRPNRQTHPDALETVRELTAACAGAGLSTHGLKMDLARRLVDYKVDVEVLPILQERFDLRDGRKVIDQHDDFRIRLLQRMMMRTATELKLPEGSMTIRQALTNALTEVSVYWIDENGIRQRARFDVLKPVFSGDLKSITQWKKTNFKKALLEEVIMRGYMIQAAHYEEGRIQLRKAVAEGRVFGGTKRELKLLERIARSDYWAWVFIFAKMDGAAQVRSIVIRPDASAQFIKAQQQREEALANFLFQREFHGGLDTPWFDPEVVWEPAEDEWPLFSVLGQ